jgi:hypothetical protein
LPLLDRIGRRSHRAAALLCTTLTHDNALIYQLQGTVTLADSAAAGRLAAAPVCIRFLTATCSKCLRVRKFQIFSAGTDSAFVPESRSGHRSWHNMVIDAGMCCAPCTPPAVARFGRALIFRACSSSTGKFSSCARSVSSLRVSEEKEKNNMRAFWHLLDCNVARGAVPVRGRLIQPSTLQIVE